MGLETTEQTAAVFQGAIVADDADFHLSAWTIESYIRCNSRSSVGECILLSRQGASALDNNYLVSLDSSDGGLTGTFRDAGGTVRSVTGTVSGFVSDAWYQVAYTWDGTDAKLFVRAPGGTYALLATATPGATPDSAHAGDLYLFAGSASDLTRGFALDEVRIWNAARDLATLQAASNLRLVSDESGLVWYGRADDGLDALADTLTDRSRGNGRNATLVNGPRWTDSPSDLLYPCGMHAIGDAKVKPGALYWLSGTQQPGATIEATGTGTNADHPVSNLRSPRRARTWRSTDDTGTYTLKLGFGKVWPVAAVSFFHNLSSGAIILLELDDDSAFTSPPVSEVVTYHPGRILHVCERPWSYPYLRLSFLDAANPDGYLQVSALHAWVEEPLPDVPMAAVRVDWIDPSVTVEAGHGDRTVRRLTPSRQLAVSYPSLRRGAAARLREIRRTVGQGAPVLLALDVARRPYGRDQVYGTLSQLGKEKLYGPAGERSDLADLAVLEDRA